MANMGSPIKNRAHEQTTAINPTQRPNEPGSTMEKVKDTASSLTDQAKDVASNVASQAGQMASTAKEKSESALSSVACGMQSLAGTIRENAPREGMLGSASTSVAQTLESGGRYLKEEGLEGIGQDVTELIRRNPIPALMVGIGIGFLLARVTRS